MNYAVARECGRVEASRYVRVEMDIVAPPERVVGAFLDVEALRAWWGVEKGLVEPREGGVWALAWGVTPGGIASAAVGVVERVEERELVIGHVVFLSAERPFLGPTRIRVSVRKKSDVSSVALTEEGYGEGPEWERTLAESRQGWPSALRELKTWLEGAGGR